MEIVIRQAESGDFPAVFSMIKALAAFEQAADQVKNSIKAMQAEKDHFTCYIAENQKHEVLGFALCFIAYHTWVGKSLYLDDLYVKETYRRKGIATRLMKKVFELARKENCKRLRFQVLHWNEDAIRLYQKWGAGIDNSWLNCDFDTEQIQKFNPDILDH
jgi:ribosomal protein S18 acetylase RimI-like enzyme